MTSTHIQRFFVGRFELHTNYVQVALSFNTQPLISLHIPTA